MSSPRQSKTALGHLLTVGGSGGNSPRFVPPVLREVGKLAAGVASVSTTGSATGNPRNKCALKPGHSHMDWVRLSNSKDLTGLGERAGKLEMWIQDISSTVMKWKNAFCFYDEEALQYKYVTLEELARHNKISDGWLAINGKVFNVTSYMPFHPGGVEELKKGLGIDATKLFYEVHNWVNCDSLLKSCYVGRLITSPLQDMREPNPPNDPDQPLNRTEEAVRSPTPPPGPSINGQPGNEPIDIVQTSNENGVQNATTEESLHVHSYQKTHDNSYFELTTSNVYTQSHCIPSQTPGMPRFQWVQKLKLVCISFRRKRFTNPLVEARMLSPCAVQVTMWYDNKTVVNEVIFTEEVKWPPAMTAIEEDGKIELKFLKVKENLWNNYGILKQVTKMGGFLEDKRVDYVLKEKREIAPNMFLLEVQRMDGLLISVPIGHHVRVFNGSGDEALSKSYTPIPQPKIIFPIPLNATWASDTITLMVKRYEEGNVSKFICDAVEGTVFQLSRPISPGLELVRIHDRDRFICLAAGTGLTPMLSLMMCILQRRTKKCKRFATLLCNSKKENIPFLKEYVELLKEDRQANNRLSVKHILTDPEMPKEPNFLKGPISIHHVRDAIVQIYAPEKGVKEDLFVFVCGPPSFNDVCRTFLTELQVPDDQTFVFEG